MTELKPCPFCGGKVKIVPEGDYHEATCTECGVCKIGYTYADAIMEWNHRVGDNDVTDTNVGKMTEQEAIEELRIARESNSLTEYPSNESLDVAIEALQKQIPSYVVPTIDDEFGEEEVYYHCKQCGVMFYTWMNRYRRTNYCGYCGQKVTEG